MTHPVHEAINAVYIEHSRRVLATLIRLLGDFDVAEEALHDAFRAALEQWPREGIPANPRAWLVSAGRFKAIDGLRRRSRFTPLENEAGERADVAVLDTAAWADDESVEDDRLRLIFTCCHPALAADAQIALTLREVCGLTTEQIAQAFLTPAPTLAQRIVRAKSKIRDARIPYQVPTPAELPGRLDAVLRVIYLVFNEGYEASSGQQLTRQDLSAEAIRLGRLVAELLPEPEVLGLLALMLLHESRREARTSPSGELVRLDEQDRSRWDRALIAEGTRLVRRALLSRPLRVLHDPGRHLRGACRGARQRRDGLERDCRALRHPAARRSLPDHRAESRGRSGHARRARERGRGSSTRSSSAAICAITGWRTQRAQTCAGASDG